MILVLSGLSASLLIMPVAIHRFFFHIRVKDELVELTNRLAIAGLGVLSLCMVGAIVLTSDESAGPLGAGICGAVAAIMFGTVWFLVPIWLRGRAVSGRQSAINGAAQGRQQDHK